MLGLITDREQVNVDRRNALAAKGWNAMTDSEKAEWTGDILSPSLAGYSEPVNLLPNDNYYSDVVVLKFKNRTIIAEPLIDGTYLYAVVVVGDAADFENKTLTLSVDAIASDGGTPLIAPYWHDSTGFDVIPASLSAEGSVTFDAGANTGGRESLALYIYATTDTAVAAGSSIIYTGVMLEMGDVRHPYVPYTKELPTSARKGSYNFTDLNRVERAVEELAEEFGLTLSVKTDWAMWDVPTEADMERFLQNVRVIREHIGVSTSVPSAPVSMKKLTYTAANSIESILMAVDSALSGVYRCGEIYCGEE